MSREERKEGEMGSGVWISLPFWVGLSERREGGDRSERRREERENGRIRPRVSKFQPPVLLRCPFPFPVVKTPKWSLALEICVAASAR